MTSLETINDIEAELWEAREAAARFFGDIEAEGEWGPQILNDEDVVLGVSPGGFSEDIHISPTDALAEIDDALD